MQELLDSPNEKDPANGPPNQMCAAALRFHAVGPAELRSRLCADLLTYLIGENRKANVAVARHRILDVVSHHKLRDIADSDTIQ